MQPVTDARSWMAVLFLAILASACTGKAPGRGGGMMGGGMSGGGMPMMAQAEADTAAAPRPAAVVAESAATCPPITQPLVDEGRRLFGTTGTCYACHGPDAAGTAAAPNLTDATWLDTDGSYGSIVMLIRSGVSRPRQFPARMPPRGGAPLTDVQTCAVGAYVRSLGGER